MALQQAAKSSFRQIQGVVVSAGLMEKTVKVRIGVQKWDKHIRKHWNMYDHLLVHDPHSSLRLGDVVAVSPGWRASKCVRHVVTSIIAPFGDPIEARPPVPTEEERLAERAKKRIAKDERRATTKALAGLELKIGEVEERVQEFAKEMKRSRLGNPLKNKA